MLRLAWAGAALLAWAVPAPAMAQAQVEVEIGGGFHAAVEVEDFIRLPSVPTLDVRVVRWGGGRWGIAGQVIAGFGAADPNEHGVMERRNPAYFQVMARYRTADAGKTQLYAGIGGGVGRVEETRRSGERSTYWFPHLLALEAVVSRTVTERLSIRGGITVVLPAHVHVHPVVLAAFRF